MADGGSSERHEDVDLTRVAEAYTVGRKRKTAAAMPRSTIGPRFGVCQIDPEIDYFYPQVADREPLDKNIVKAGFDIHRR